MRLNQKRTSEKITFAVIIYVYNCIYMQFKLFKSAIIALYITRKW